MNSERFSNGWPIRPPSDPAAVSARAFVVCPVAAGASLPCADLYRLAFAQAQAVVRPSIVERLQRDLCN
jgi:hypothetical protein